MILIFESEFTGIQDRKEVTSYTPEFETSQTKKERMKKTQEMWRREFRFRDIRRL